MLNIVLFSLPIILLSTYWEPALSINALEFRQALLGTKAAPVPTACGTTATIICKNCNQLKYCTRSGSGTPTEHLVTTCPGTQTCATGSCIDDPKKPCIACATVKFNCPQAGLFPDADCTKYHICIKSSTGVLVDYPQTCEADGNTKYGFSLETFTCSIKLEESKCPTNIYPVCPTDPAMKAIAQNPEIYSFCIQNGDENCPIFQYCPFGKHFINNVCTNPPPKTNPPEPQPNPNPTP